MGDLDPVSTDSTLSLYQKINSLEQRVTNLERNKELIITPFGGYVEMTNNVVTTTVPVNLTWTGGRVYCFGGGNGISLGEISDSPAHIGWELKYGSYTVYNTAIIDMTTNLMSVAIPFSSRRIDLDLAGQGISPGNVSLTVRPTGSHWPDFPEKIGAYSSGFFIEWPTK